MQAEKPLGLNSRSEGFQGKREFWWRGGASIGNSPSPGPPFWTGQRQRDWGKRLAKRGRGGRKCPKTLANPVANWRGGFFKKSFYRKKFISTGAFLPIGFSPSSTMSKCPFSGKVIPINRAKGTLSECWLEKFKWNSLDQQS